MTRTTNADSALLHCRLRTSHGVKSGSELDTITLTDPRHTSSSRGHINISFRRTVKVSEAVKASNLPPDLGAFPLHHVNGPLGWKLPESMRAKGGVFFPMHDNEAMWINFDSCRPFAIKVYAGGVNCVTGKSVKGGEAEENRLTTKKNTQDYVVVPQQHWLDGIATEAGMVRQFVAAPTGNGFTIEAQITQSESVAGLQFDVVPYRGDIISVKTLTGKELVITTTDPTTTIGKIKSMIEDLTGVPPVRQRLIYGGKQLQDSWAIGDYGIGPDSTLHLVNRLRGGGWCEDDEASDDGKEAGKSGTEMGLAAGGLLKQYIERDTMGLEAWDWDRTTAFNIQIVHADVFESITGLPPPPCPVDEATYKAYGGKYFDLPGKKSDIHGDFAEVESVQSLEIKKLVEEFLKMDPMVKLNPAGPLMKLPLR